MPEGTEDASGAVATPLPAEISPDGAPATTDDAVADGEGRDYLVTAVVHFRARGHDLASAARIARAMFADELERSELFGDGAVATVLAD